MTIARPVAMAPTHRTEEDAAYLSCGLDADDPEMKVDESVVSNSFATMSENGPALSPDERQALKAIEAAYPTKNEDSKETANDDNDENSRGNWSNKLDFIMSAVSFAVGMGNIWRFPYMCYKNGGGAFLIPYLLMVFVAGVPMMFMEFAFGQYGSLGIVSIWRAVPLFQGIGWTMFLVSFLSCIYYNLLIVYSFFYLFSSFARDIPWRDCDNAWNTPACGGMFAMRNCTLNNGTWYNNTCFGTLTALPAEVQASIQNSTGALNMTSLLGLKAKSPADEYFHHYMLAISDGLDDMGAPRWQLVLLLLMCWTLVAICLSKGIKSFGKASYVTSLFPYIILVILLARGLTLEGSVDGILYYLTPKFEKLASAEVWGDAAIQVFYSMSICWGGLITLASYNKFNNNCLRDSFVVAAGDCLTSIFAGVVIFAIIGFMANELKVPIDEVATQGAGLAFIIYPSAVASLPISPLWAILFMLMLINLGIGTQFTLVTTSHTTLLDVFSGSLRKGRRPLMLLLAMCAFCFLVGISMTTRGGMYVLQLMDFYAPSYALLTIGITETIAISWVYGYQRFFKDIEQMLGYKPHIFWMVCWKFITPALVLFILLFTLVDFQPSRYGDYEYPLWADILGWLITLVEVACIPGVAVYKICTADSSLSLGQKIRFLCRPSPDWGPATTKDIPNKDDAMVPLTDLKHHNGLDAPHHTVLVDDIITVTPLEHKEAV